MGWISTHKPKGEPIAAFFDRQGTTRWTSDAPHTYRVLDSALVAASTWYAAVERIHKDTSEREVFALVILVRMQKAQFPGAFNFSYKTISEDMGPCEARSPERILDQLTPTTSVHANEWRQRCRTIHAQRKALPTLYVGAALRFAEPVSFGTRGQASEFTILQSRGSRVTCSAIGLPFRAALPRSFVRERAAGSGITVTMPVRSS